MIRITLIFLLLLPTIFLAQVLLPTSETSFEPQHNFNPEIIKLKGVKKITFEIIDKKDFEVAVDKNLVETYEFNADGLLTRYYYTNIVKTIEKHIPIYGRRGKVSTRVETEYLYDTVSTCYFYSGKNLVLKIFLLRWSY